MKSHNYIQMEMLSMQVSSLSSRGSPNSVSGSE